MKFELFVGLRYLLARHKHKFISITSIISMAGITVGVGALIVVISVMSGFGNELREKIIGANPHMIIRKGQGLGIKAPDKLMEKIEALDHVLATSPFISGEAILKSKGFPTGVVLRGVDPRREVNVTKISQYVTAGSLDLENNGIAIGTELSRRLGANLGDEIKVVTAAKSRPTRFKVATIFNTGMYEYDDKLAFVSLKNAQELYGVGEVVGAIGVKLDNPEEADEAKALIREALGYKFWVMI